MKNSGSQAIYQQHQHKNSNTVASPIIGNQTPKGILTKKEKKMEVNVMKILQDIEDALQQEILAVPGQERVSKNQSQSDNYRNYTINNIHKTSKGDLVKTNHKTSSSKKQVHNTNTRQSNKTASRFVKK